MGNYNNRFTWQNPAELVLPVKVVYQHEAIRPFRDLYDWRFMKAAKIRADMHGHVGKDLATFFRSCRFLCAVQ